MNKFLAVFSAILVLFLWSCKSSDKKEVNTVEVEVNKADYTIAFGSCNKQNTTNLLWEPILAHQPDVWIWGGDNVYADTDNMTKLKADYNQQLADTSYQKLIASTKVFGTWDDHDYGLNDGGLEFSKKKESQQEFLNFLGVSKTDARRNREGVYHSEVIDLDQGSIKIMVLDTRYFRSGLTDDSIFGKRYQPNAYGEGTVLGAAQWQWLEDELKTSEADFNIIVSSIQFLSNEHGFETWGNFPHEVDRLKNVIIDAKANAVLLLSGDRHISEFSKIELEGLDYPLIDFTSSGLTHAYTRFSGEPNPYRVGDVVAEISFGLLHFDFENNTIEMEMRGENNIKQHQLKQQY